MALVFDVRNILTEAFKKTGVEWHIKGVLNGKGEPLYALVLKVKRYLRITGEISIVQPRVSILTLMNT